MTSLIAPALPRDSSMPRQQFLFLLIIKWEKGGGGGRVGGVDCFHPLLCQLTTHCGTAGTLTNGNSSGATSAAQARIPLNPLNSTKFIEFTSPLE